ncbi:MAG: thioredoxin family protein, partial [Bacteroidales bacterium]|nr:thioredoxin family protein [Bacteroidales bacterium]
ITLLIIAILMYTLSAYSQREKLYDANIDGLQQFKDTQKQAKNEDKHIMIQIGGNWCSRCYKFHDFYTKDAILDSLINADYVVIRVNYDKSMKN